MALAPCPSCRRHVDVASENCPFCGSACAGLEPKLAPLARMSRKALALASTMVIAGCSDDQGNNVPVYGAPFDAVADTTSSSDSATSTDSGSTTDGATSSDSGTDSATEDSGSDVQDTGAPLPPYGLPPSDGG